MLHFQLYRKIPLFSLSLLILTALMGCAPKSNRFGIVFLSDNGVAGTSDIYRIPDDTQNKFEQLTFTPTVGEYQLLVSKNGDKIIFQTGITGSEAQPSELTIEKLNHIYLLDAATKKLEDMTDAFYAQPFGESSIPTDWSPDEKQFAVVTYSAGLGIMDIDGANKKFISIPSLDETPTMIVNVKWSPDGKKLLLSRELVGSSITQQLQDHGDALLIYDLENGNLGQQLTDYQEGCLLPQWSPTSQQIVAICNTSTVEGGGPWTIRIFSTTNPGQPYEHLILSPCQDPSWSPDGKQIAFSCDKGTNQDGLFVINSDGSGIHEVNLENLGSPTILRYPTWSPNGSQIIYVAGTDASHENIYSVNPDGSNNHALTNQEASYSIVSVYPVP